MDIYVVQPGDTLEAIAQFFGITIEKIMRDNELDDPEDLVIGQTLVITYPEQSYTVEEGDTLSSIANAFGVSILQILRNNPSISERGLLIPGETINISFQTIRQMSVNGYAYPYIKRDTLLKTLPSLTYLTIFNYQTTEEGDLSSFFDDTEIIQTAKDYGVVPLMMTSSTTLQGQLNIQVTYEILVNEEYQDKYIDNILQILKTKGYGGINMSFNYINAANFPYYEAFTIKAANRIRSEGFLFFAIINPNIITVSDEPFFTRVDYSRIGEAANGLGFIQFIWGENYGPPAPISNSQSIQEFTEYLTSMLPPEIIKIGTVLISYDWELPYIPGLTRATSLTLDAALRLALEVGADIEFDEESQTPYYYYNRITFGVPARHIVWSVDARSINAINNIILSYNLNGTAIWTIMVYYPQLWLILNSQYEVVKLIRENPDAILNAIQR